MSDKINQDHVIHKEEDVTNPNTTYSAECDQNNMCPNPIFITCKNKQNKIRMRSVGVNDDRAKAVSH
jgi:hypothetical protein